MQMLDRPSLPRETTTPSDIALFAIRRGPGRHCADKSASLPGAAKYSFRPHQRGRRTRFATLAELDLAIDPGPARQCCSVPRWRRRCCHRRPPAHKPCARAHQTASPSASPGHPDLQALQGRDAVDAIAPNDVSKLNELVHRPRSDPTRALGQDGGPPTALWCSPSASKR